MQRKAEILVIGSGPAGMVAAITAKQFHPKREVLVIKKVDHGCVPCGIPYMLSSLKDPTDNRSSSVAALRKKHIEAVTKEVVKIDRSLKEVTTADGARYIYEKLVLALGSLPIIPKIAGIEKKGVFPVYKDMDYLVPSINEIKKSKSVLVVGGGFIGVEFADEIAAIPGIKVYLVELLPSVLSNSFDQEFADLAVEKLQAKGIELINGVKVEKILGGEQVEGALLSDGQELRVDSVVLGIGAIPNSILAKDARLDLNNDGAIVVDEYMRSSDPSIFAVGDVASKTDFFTEKQTSVMLASTATAEARIAGANLYALKDLKGCNVKRVGGTIAIYSTCIDGLVLGSAGMTESRARQNGYEIIVGNYQGIDRHPTTMPGAARTRLKLIFSAKSGVLLGGQIAGGVSSSELANILGVAIQAGMSIADLVAMQFATHPYLTSSPTHYSIVTAAQDAVEKL